MEPVRILVVDDHVMFGESLAHLLSTKAGLIVVGVATSGEEAITLVERLRPNVVLMDIEMNDMDGIEATKLVTQKYPGTKIIALTMHSEEEYIIQIIKAGARGYILKNFSSSLILDAIKSVMGGKYAFDSKTSVDTLENLIKLMRDRNVEDGSTLTSHEVKILKLISEGYTNKGISEELHISVHTARNHVANIFLKLGCNNRTKAVRVAQKRKIL